MKLRRVKLIVHIPVDKLDHALVKRWLTRHDGVSQRYSYAPGMPAPEEYADLTAPQRTHLMQGDLRTRVSALVNYLRRHYPTPAGRGKATVLLFKTDARLRGYCQQEDVPYAEIRDAGAVYLHDLHVILVRPGTVNLLDSRKSQEWAVGVRYVAHEWFHAMREQSGRFRPLEEGGAEVFANHVSYRVTGVQNARLNLLTYAEYRQGVERMGEAARGSGQAAEWAMASRRKPQVAWLRSELEKLRLNPQQVARILEYDDAKPNLWLSAVNNAVKRKEEP